MVKDRLFFNPGPLAFGKGLAYLFAFLTTVFFVKVNERAYVFGIFSYCCGVIFDYIEISVYRDDKCKFVKNIATILSILMFILGVLALVIALMYDTIPDFVAVLPKYRIWVNIFLTAFWGIPLANGIWLWIKYVNREETEKITVSRKAVSGYYIKP